MKKFIIIPLLFISIILSATKYYVKTGGSDASAGTSDATAWAHHPWMSTWTGAVTLVAGDTVYMNRGNTWTKTTGASAYLTVGQNGTTTDYIVTTAYGSGAKPIIYISTALAYPVIDALGKSYIKFDNLEIKHYQKGKIGNELYTGIRMRIDGSGNPSHDFVITNCTIHDCPSLGIFGWNYCYNIIVGDTTTTACASTTQYSNQIYDCGLGGILLEGRNITVGGLSNFMIYFNYIHDIDNPATIGGDATALRISGEYYWSSGCEIKYNMVRDCPDRDGIFCGNTNNTEVQYNYVYNTLQGITAISGVRSDGETPRLNDIYIDYNTVENPGTSFSGATKFISCIGDTDIYRVTRGYIRYNKLFFTTRPADEESAAGITIKNIDSLIVDGNNISGGPDGISYGAIYIDSAGFQKGLIIRKNFTKDWYYGVNAMATTFDGDVLFNNNIFYSDYRGFMGENDTIDGIFNFYNNTDIVKSSSASPIILDFDGSVLSATSGMNIKNNIFSMSSSVVSGVYLSTPGTLDGSLVIDNNLYWNLTDATPFYLTGVAHNFANWQGHGYDTYGLNATNPLFRSSSSYIKDTNFDIKSASPCINAGMMVGLSSDYSGARIKDFPDIGAFEYGNRFLIIK
jgi:hypothetical protein